MDVFVDLVAEQDRLEGILETLDDDAWRSPSAAAGWTIADVVLHLAQTEEAVVATVRAGEIGDWWVGPSETTDAAVERMVQSQRDEPAAVFARWRDARRAAVDALRQVDPQRPLTWIAAPMRSRALATTRIAEHWAHGLDVTEPLGIPFPDTDRLRHVAWLGHRTLPYASKLAGSSPTTCGACSPLPTARRGVLVPKVASPRSGVRRARSAGSGRSGSAPRTRGSRPPAPTPPRPSGCCATTRAEPRTGEEGAPRDQGDALTCRCHRMVHGRDSGVDPETVERLRLFDALPDAIFVVDPGGTLIFATVAAERLLGWDADEWVGRSALDLIHPDDLAMVLVSLESVQAKAAGNPIDVRVATADGGWRYLEVVGAPLTGVPGLEGVVVAARDFTERRRFEVAGDDDARFRALVQHSPVITMLVDADGVVRSVSGAFARILGHDPEHLLGTELVGWVVPPQRAHVRAALHAATAAAGVVNFDAALPHRDDAREVPLEFHVVNLLDDPVVEGLVVTASDVSVLRETQASLRHLATHDTLTGLANRSLLVERLEAALERVPSAGPVTVFFIDLDRFKPVNDLLGHEAGDRLLVEVAERLGSVVRASDTLARLGGDEFVVVAEAMSDGRDARVLARRLERVVSEPFLLGAGPTQIHASVGFARSEEGSTAESLLAEADGAMYLVKSARRGELRRTVVRVSERRALAERLVVALEERQLRVHYQPIVDVRSGRATGVEALVRWQHPEQGLLYPADFLSVAEEVGLDGDIGRYVLEEACRQHGRWEQARPDRAFTVAVNLSATQLVDPALPATVSEVVERTGIAPAALHLEISERAILERVTRGTARPATASLGALKELGVQLAVDDFGTGYSSLSHVRRLPVDAIKIDQSFVAGLGRNRNDTSIVEAVIGLAHAMHLTPIAEGVENVDQAAALAALGCNLAQGHLYAPALSPEELESHLDDDVVVLAAVDRQARRRLGRTG